jgi:DNA-binding GntR family transcriptional regulator
LRTTDPDAFVRRYHDRFARVRPKYAQLRDMLTAALDDQLWREGDQVPTEHALAQAAGCSLGTVQKAVHGLVEDGRLVRTAGRGTFVLKPRFHLGAPFLSARFLMDDRDGILPIDAVIVGLTEMDDAGPWSDALRPVNGEVTRLERVFDVNGEFLILSRFYVDPVRFPAFREFDKARLESANLKVLLAQTYRLPSILHRQTVRFQKFTRDVYRHVRCRAGTTGLLQTVKASIHTDEVVYFHELYIPPNNRTLQLPDTVLRGAVDPT